MKCFTIYHEGNKIEVLNSILGKETIMINGEIVSSKYSLFGTEHNFKLKNNDSNCRIVLGLSRNGHTIDFYKDDKAIIESSKGGCLLFAFSGIFLGIFVWFFIRTLIASLV